jgi:hypothetical protein
MLLQGSEQGTGETEVAFHELRLFLGSVYTGKVEDKSTVLGKGIQKAFLRIDVKEVQLLITLVA